MNRRQAIAALSIGLVGVRLGSTAYAAPDATASPVLDALADGGAPQQQDALLGAADLHRLDQILARLKRLERVAGHANFNLLDYTGAVRLAAGHKSVGAFSKAEQDFIEQLFYTDAKDYGFIGPRLVQDLDYRIAPEQREKVLHSGHYLFKERALEIYRRLHQDIGSRLLLTSGIRGVVKQTYLFLARVRYSRGNITVAARSLAPPAYSFHSIGDFDVGQSDFGYANFTRRFVESEVYSRLQDLDYVSNRYTVGNPLGMRFEPWHVEVA